MRAVVLTCAGLLAGVGQAYGETAQPAAPIDRPFPDYPSAAGITDGYVKLRFTIDSEGHVSEAFVVESTPGGLFDAAAIAGVKRWTYRPRLVDGKPVEQPDNMIAIRFKPPANPAPVWLNPEPPFYPREAFVARLEGKVTVGFDVAADGTTANAHILDTTAPGVFDAVSIADINNRFYQPVIVDGQPQPSPGQRAVIEYKLADAQVRPNPIYTPKPVYPSAAEYAGANGFCALDLTIADDGSVAKAVLEQSFPRGMFEQSCMGAIKRWRFETREQVGAPMAQHLKYMFNYRIQGQTDREVHYLRRGQWIELEYTLTAEGRAKDIKVVGQSEPDLPLRKAVEQLEKMKFQPIMENGVAVETPHMKIKID
jgi:TonB family protein